jgi:ketosteroid isomerase-like protein
MIFRNTKSSADRGSNIMEPRQLVQAWVAAFNRADVAALANMYSEDATNHQVAEGPVVGRSAIRDMFVREFARAKMTCIVENVPIPGAP